MATEAHATVYGGPAGRIRNRPRSRNNVTVRLVGIHPSEGTNKVTETRMNATEAKETEQITQKIINHT